MNYFEHAFGKQWYMLNIICLRLVELFPQEGIDVKPQLHAAHTTCLSTA